MKRSFLLLIFLASSLFGSCVKKINGAYQCRCYGGFTGKGATMPIVAETKKEAKAKCNDLNDPPGTADGFGDCKLK